MGIAAGIGSVFEDIVNFHGNILRFRFFSTGSTPTDYNSTKTYTQSGVDLYTSGIVQYSRNERKSSYWPIKSEAGYVPENELRVYLSAGFSLSGTFKFGVGSPTTTEWYAPVEFGIYAPELNGARVYQRMDARILTTGSLFGET